MFEINYNFTPFISQALLTFRLSSLLNNAAICAESYQYKIQPSIDSQRLPNLVVSRGKITKVNLHFSTVPPEL